MKTTRVNLWSVRAAAEGSWQPWEERLPSPLDLYPHHAAGGPAGKPIECQPHAMQVDQIFLEIETDAGLSGWYGPVGAAAADLVRRHLAAWLVGQDPLPVTALWDQMMRLTFGGRSGDWPFAVGVVDLALWDLRGKAFGRPVYELLGGPTRPDVPCSWVPLGATVQPAAAVPRALAAKAAGFQSQKWFPRRGVADGRAGLRETVAFFSALREALGADYPLALDAWTSWNLDYAMLATRSLENLNLAWIEEPLHPNDLAGWRKLRRRTPVCLAGGEHLFVQAEAKPFLDEGLLDYFQMDVTWCGGLTGALRLAPLAEAAGVPLVPHAGCPLATLQLAAALPLGSVLEVPWMPFIAERECLALDDPPRPVRGRLSLPTRPGLSIALREDRISKRERIGGS